MRPLEGRIALVTGVSRERGIGAATVRALAGLGAGIVFTHWRPFDRAADWGADEAFPDRLEAELRSAGTLITGIEIDLMPAEAASHLMAEATRFGSISILVNNAAYSTRDDFRTLDVATLDAHFAVNVRAPILLSAELARRHVSGPGCIINLTSGSGLAPMPGEISYATTKAAIEAFTRTFAVEVAPLGITVNAVNPGPTDTGWMKEELKAALLPKFPSGRLGRPEDAARLIAWLATDDAAWITGQTIHSEGGFLRQ